MSKLYRQKNKGYLRMPNTTFCMALSSVSKNFLKNGISWNIAKYAEILPENGGISLNLSIHKERDATYN